MKSDARFDHAMKLLGAGEFQAALKEFRDLSSHAEEQTSKSDYIYGELLSLVYLKRTDEARRLLDKTQDLFWDSDESRARLDLIRIQIDSEDDKWDKVLPALEHMADRYAHILHEPQLRDIYEEIQLRKGTYLASLGKFKEALPLLEEAVNFSPSLVTGDLYRELGRTYLSLGSPDRAEQIFLKALDEGLDDASAADTRYWLGVIEMGAKRYPEALKHFKLAESLARTQHSSPQWQSQLLKAMAVCFGELGSLEEAKSYALASKRIASLTKLQ